MELILEDSSALLLTNKRVCTLMKSKSKNGAVKKKIRQPLITDSPSIAVLWIKHPRKYKKNARKNIKDSLSPPDYSLLKNAKRYILIVKNAVEKFPSRILILLFSFSAINNVSETLICLEKEQKNYEYFDILYI